MTDDDPVVEDTAPPAEHRWPMAVATLAAGGLHQLLPKEFLVSPRWVFPAFLLVFLGVLVAGDPGLIDRQRPWLKVTTGLMIMSIAVANAVTAIRLVKGILWGASFDSAGLLLAVGAIVWTTNVIIFALWFWDFDGGGASARAASRHRVGVAFLFPEMANSDLVPPRWAPQFVDYLALSFNTATAFGPTDVSALRRSAKLMVIAESAISLALATLVVARAVNIM
ncbi:hypothetical protein SAMN05216410_1500 [Sanguibacter gelidistatuariae]|uniref:DUF1345 domain-containing protein n=1 Tax=Sanguibacter gelidistatuariae TaxID=1814289 RepID=A0A1G6K5P1_9MICO|nr:hypothetical protein [Sanguibacter gelidistatuariae]SDC25925.1 hypothetical protein SAMN05216410_1500 [Sanguibacter gelidistatuariae]